MPTDFPDPEVLHVSPQALRIRPRTSGAYTRHRNIVYAHLHGVALYFDLFEPPAPNGRLVIDVVSGAWHSDVVRFNEHIGLGVIDALCARGFTVLAVSPGSANLFTAPEMIAHIHAAQRYAQRLAPQRHLDPTRTGMLGVSAGGHLAALAALVSPQAATPVAALGLIFPPTDLVDFGGVGFTGETASGLDISTLLFRDGVQHHTAGEVEGIKRALSPALHTFTNPPPTYLLHGTADPVVPLAHSVKLQHALKAAGGDVTLAIKEGGAHPWRDIRVDLDNMAAWFVGQLV